MQSVVIFGVGSALLADFEESAARARLTIAAAVRNIEGENFFSSPLRVINVGDLTAHLKELPVLIPLFTPANRLRAVREAIQLGFAGVHSLVDPTVIRPRTLVHGQGLFVNAGCTLGAASEYGALVLINRAAAIGHHVRCGDFCSIGPGAVVAGNVRIGRGAVIGTGAVVLPARCIGDSAIVGAGAVVAKDVPARCLVLGNPARIVGRNLPALEAHDFAI